MPPEAMATIADMARAHGVDLDQDVYAGAPHGYSMADSSKYDEGAAERHFEELRRHLDRHLKG
jgi:carboxymethylenebutenolidase